MSHPTRRYELAQLRTALRGYLDAFAEELRLGTETRHLERLRVLCHLLLEKLVMRGGATLETQGFERRLQDLVATAPRPSSPPSLRVVH